MSVIERAIAAARRETGKRSELSPGQKALLRNLASRGMPEFYATCRATGCTPVEAERLHEDGLVVIDGNDDENDPIPSSTSPRPARRLRGHECYRQEGNREAS